MPIAAMTAFDEAVTWRRCFAFEPLSVSAKVALSPFPDGSGLVVLCGLGLSYSWTFWRLDSLGKMLEQTPFPPMPTSVGVTPADDAGKTVWPGVEATAGSTTN